MGIGASTSSESEKVGWLVRHDGYASPWAQFVLRRYGSGLAATGMALNSGLPWLLRQRIQDWDVCGIVVELGPTCISFGRSLGSHIGGDSSPGMTYCITIRFGEHGSGGWLWYCKPREWLLQLHKVVLERVPASVPSQVPAEMEGAQLQGAPEGQPRWPGRGRHLFEEADESNGQCVAPATGEVDTKVTSLEQEQVTNPDQVEHQLSMYFSNADGHIGLLCLPVLPSCKDKIEEVMPLWRHGCEVPFAWGTQMLTTAQDFARLHESAINMPDLLLFGLESDLASSLTPDWTWEKYPRGFGEVTHASYIDLPAEETSASSNEAGATAPEKPTSET